MYQKNLICQRSTRCCLERPELASAVCSYQSVHVRTEAPPVSDYDNPVKRERLNLISGADDEKSQEDRDFLFAELRRHQLSQCALPVGACQYSLSPRVRPQAPGQRFDHNRERHGGYRVSARIRRTICQWRGFAKNQSVMEEHLLGFILDPDQRTFFESQVSSRTFAQEGLGTAERRSPEPAPADSARLPV